MVRNFEVGEFVQHEIYEMARGGQTSRTYYGKVIKIKQPRVLVENKNGERSWFAACNCYLSDKKNIISR